MAWPAIRNPDYPFGEKLLRRKIMSRFESGHELTRSTATVSKREFSLSWKQLTEADYQTLATFFDSQGAESFAWNHPATNEAINVRFVESELDWTIPFYGHRAGSVLLHEVL